MKGINASTAILLVIFFSCDRPKAKNDELGYRNFRAAETEWKSKRNTQVVRDIEYAATEVPLSYYILKEAGQEDATLVDSVANAHKGERIIEFEFAHEDERDLLGDDFTSMAYKRGVEYLAFHIQKDFYLVTSRNDTIPCEGVQMERSYKLSPRQKVMLFFTGVPPQDQVQLIYRDRLFQNGTIKFKLKENPTKIDL